MKKKFNDTISIDEHTWFYVEDTELSVVKEVFNSKGAFAKTELVSVPFATIVKHPNFKKYQAECDRRNNGTN